MFRRQAASGRPNGSSLFKWRFSRLSQSSQTLASDSNGSSSKSSKAPNSGFEANRGDPSLRSVKMRRSAEDLASHGSKQQQGQQKKQQMSRTNEPREAQTLMRDTNVQRNSSTSSRDEQLKELQRKTASLPVVAAASLSVIDARFSSVVRVECAAGALLIRQTLERLLLSSHTWRPDPVSARSASMEAVRCQLANLQVLAELVSVRLTDCEGCDHEEAGDCARRFSACCVQLLELGHSLAYQRLLALPGVIESPAACLCLSSILHSCDRLLAAVYGLQLAASDSPAVIGQCEQASEALSDLSSACRLPLDKVCDPTDREALQLCLRSVTATSALLLHSVRSSHNRPADADSRGRVDAAADSVRPAVATLAAVAAETRFSGRPLRLPAAAATQRVSELCRLLPIAACAAELLSEFAAAECRSSRVGEFVAGLRVACAELDTWLSAEP